MTIPETDKLLGKEPKEPTSAEIRERVALYRERQHRRLGMLSNEMGLREIKSHCALEAEGKRMISFALDSPLLSARTFHKVLKIARTIAVLEDVPEIITHHLMETPGYRPRTNHRA